MSNAPAGLLYSKSHEWARLEGDQAVIGITAFAQESLGDITYVELPQAGDALAADKEFGSVESVKAAGVNQPALVRPREGGGYEIIAGHRRHRASELAEKETMPVIVKYLRLSWPALHKITNKCCKEKGHGLLCHGLYHPFQI